MARDCHLVDLQKLLGTKSYEGGVRGVDANVTRLILRRGEVR